MNTGTFHYSTGCSRSEIPEKKLNNKENHAFLTPLERKPNCVFGRNNFMNFWYKQTEENIDILFHPQTHFGFVRTQKCMSSKLLQFLSMVLHFRHPVAVFLCNPCQKLRGNMLGNNQKMFPFSVFHNFVSNYSTVLKYRDINLKWFFF